MIHLLQGLGCLHFVNISDFTSIFINSGLNNLVDSDDDDEEDSDDIASEDSDDEAPEEAKEEVKQKKVEYIPSSEEDDDEEGNDDEEEALSDEDVKEMIVLATETTKNSAGNKEEALNNTSEDPSSEDSDDDDVPQVNRKVWQNEENMNFLSMLQLLGKDQLDTVVYQERPGKVAVEYDFHDKDERKHIRKLLKVSGAIWKAYYEHEPSTESGYGRSHAPGFNTESDGENAPPVVASQATSISGFVTA